MAKPIKGDSIPRKSLLVLLELASLPGIVHRSLALAIGVLLLSKSVAATPARFSPLSNRSFSEEGWGGSPSLAQQPAATSQDATRAAAEQAFQEGVQLYKQGTAEFLRQAIAKWEEALALYRAVGDRAWEGTTLLRIGQIYSNLGEKQKALDYYNQALPLLRAVGAKSGEAVILNNIGAVYDDIGEKQKALNYYNQALPLLRALGDKAQEAFTLNNIGHVYDTLGEKQKALEYYNQSLPLLRAAGDKVREALSLNNIGQVYDTLGEKQKALDYYNQALPLLRATGDKSGETVILNNIAVVYSQIEQVQAEIRVTSPRYANLKYPQPLTLQQIQQQVLDDDTLLLEYSLGEDRSYLWAVTNTGITSYELPKRADIEAVAQRFYEQTGRQNLPERRGIGVTPREDSDEVTAQLSQMLLSPVAGQLGQKRLLIVSDGALQYLPFAALPSPDTLGNGNNPVPLIVKHEIINLPSASTLAVIRQDLGDRKPAPKTVAVLADPVFSANDERVKTSVRASDAVSLQPATPTDVDTLALRRAAIEIGVTFNRLPHTRTEADSILKLASAAEAMQAFDFAADRATATNPQLSQYRIVHFATHGILDSKNPELSGVVLSLVDEKGTPENGFLRLHDIFNLNLPAELVVLSACQSGLGQEVKGEGLVGLTRGFMYAGAPRVLVSLWSVDDEGTSELMTRFYKKMLQEKLQPAAALRAAQIEMWQDTKWKSPYYWAAFTLQGEWR